MQVILTAVNGITLGKPKTGEEIGAVIDENDQNKLVKRNDQQIANLYFKFEHCDQPCAMNGFQATKITNHYQKLVVEELKNKIEALRINTH